MYKAAVILGTRPEIIKMSPIIRELECRGLNYFILHTGQHYSYELDKVFFEQLRLPSSDYNLEVGSGFHGEQTGKMLAGIEKILLEEKPDVVLVEGDTNTVLAGALAAAKLHIRIGHIEAGLRSFYRLMPEEINRVLTDHCSDYLFAPTSVARGNLLREGVDEEKIFVTGNTIVDAVYQNLKLAEDVEVDVTPGEYILVTSHREENVDVKHRFKGIIEGLELVYKEYDLPIIYPIHPRARKMLKRFNLKTNGVELIDPVDYLRFLKLESKAKVVLTDSGGVQEETCILGVPCVTLRDNTERPETIEVGSNILVGTDPSRILEGVNTMMNKNNRWVNPYGDGKTSERILDILEEELMIYA